MTGIIVYIMFMAIFTLIEWLDFKSYIKKEKMNGENKFRVEYGWGLKVIMIIAVLVFGVFFIINVGNCVAGWGLGVGSDLSTIIIFGFFLLLSLASVGGIVIWRIEVDQDTIYYRNYIGITKKYTAKLDKLVVKKNGKMVFYHNNKRIFSVDNNVDIGLIEFQDWCSEHVDTISYENI